MGRHVLDAIGHLLPAAVGVAVSPFPIIAIVLVLSSSRTSMSGVAFALGWVVALAAATALAIVLTGGADDASGETPAIIAWSKVAIGVALLALAATKWRTRPRPGDEPVMPGWMATLDGVEPPRALRLGAVLGGANPKNLVFTLAAATSITELGLPTAQVVVSGGVYVLFASSTVVGAVLARLASRDRSEAALERIKEFMLANNAVIMMLILLFLGSTVLGDGLAGI